MQLPTHEVPLTEIHLNRNIRLFIKREDQIHPEISGNKFWKLFYNINQYLAQEIENPMLITFGGAFSNHIAAVAALGRELGIATLGLIRGEELKQKWHENETLTKASADGMRFRFVNRQTFRDKDSLTQNLQKEFPQALIIPEGGTNQVAVNGIQHMLGNATKSFNYLCTAVGTGGTVAGISRFAEENQKVLGFKVVKDSSLEAKVSELSGKENFELIDAADGGYGKITDGNIRFINSFYDKYGVPLDPVYTGKMMRKLFELIEQNFFAEGCTILAFHTGGLQGIKGANEMLKKNERPLIKTTVK